MGNYIIDVRNLDGLVIKVNGEFIGTRVTEQGDVFFEYFFKPEDKPSKDMCKASLDLLSIYVKQEEYKKEKKRTIFNLFGLL